MMKRIYSLLAALFTLAGNQLVAQTQRTVLIEEFTQASCPNCTPANAYLNPLLAANRGKVVSIKYQVDFPGTDVMNLQNSKDSRVRDSVYDIDNTGVPEAVLDGNVSKLPATTSYYAGAPYLITQSVIDQERAIPSPVSMTATYNYNSVTDSVFSTIVVKNVTGSTLYATGTGKLKLYVSLVEMNIHFITDPPGNNGEYDFYYVNRKLYSGANGFTLPDSIPSGDSVIYQLHDTIPHYIYNVKQMAVVAWVQDLGGTKMVDQAVLATPANVTDNVMVDSTAYPTRWPLCNVSVTPSLTLTNNGTDTLVSATVGYELVGTSATGTPWAGSLAPGQSTSITLAPVNVPADFHSSLIFFINNLNGGALIDVNDANNTPQSAFISTIPATSSLDSISEQFEEGTPGYLATPISTNSAGPNHAFGFIADQFYVTNYLPVSGETSVVPCGGYGLSDASFLFFLAQRSYSGQQDGLIFDAANRLGAIYNIMTFDHAYAPQNSSVDELDVEVSTDCGNTWDTVWSKSGTALATSPSVAQTQIFTPTQTQWRTDSVDLSAYNGHDDVIVQFLATSKGGNALYIDNVNWPWYTAPSAVQQLSSTLSVSLYPNPASEKINLNLSLTQAGRFNITIVNTLGQAVKRVFEGQLIDGNSNMEINVANLASGLYNVVIRSNDEVMVKRFFVAK